MTKNVKGRARWGTVVVTAAVLGGAGILPQPAAQAAPEPQAAAAGSGQRIVYAEAGEEAGRSTYRLVSVGTDGSGRRVLRPTGAGLPAGVPLTSPVFSPDGNRLAFIAGDGVPDIWTAEPDGSRARPVLKDVKVPGGTLVQITWDVESDALLLGFKPGEGVRQVPVRRVGADGKGLTTISANWGDGVLSDPSVSRDGSITFSDDGSVRLAHDGLAAQLPVDRGDQPFTSSDGLTTAYLRYGQVFAYDHMASTERQITDEPGGARHPVLSADGRTVMYLAGKDRRPTLHSVTRPGGAGTPVPGAGSAEGRPSWVLPRLAPGPRPSYDLTGDTTNDLVARDRSGVLWLYNGAVGYFYPRKRIGAGWNVYRTLNATPDITGDGRADLIARDGSGTLWLYRGTGKPNEPYRPRQRVSGSWGGYTSLTTSPDLTGDLRPDLLARDGSGTLWLFPGTGKAAAPYGPRMRVATGWNTYGTVSATGDVTGDRRADLVARDAAGVLWVFPGTGRADAPFGPRTNAGSGWGGYTALGTIGDTHRDRLGDLLARDAAGVLWVFRGSGDPKKPYVKKYRIGADWNLYDRLA
ncbi:FG-GAP-like repeat-containing protein [Streptomyces bambusae]|uniref:FG-GAP-like repeat-containing protein n=1 Tax=Streptomyces bambusae TaxID=1550616 RepID=UPI001CFEF3E0|nr:FG-GAP-like repeat-containing protein [Streptomyces bambusae]MCB5164738.1 FG-GAP-like repeat-containing protein [Streptomyces bambusae]